MVQMNYSYLRPKKAAWLRRMYDSPFELRQELEVWQGKNATVLPLREVAGDTTLFGRGGVVAENGEYVKLSGIPTRIDLAYPVKNSEYRDEKVVYCGFLVNHWGHFLVEAVTRLWYALEGDDSIEKYVFFLQEGEEREISGNYREFFKLLKIWDKIEVINTPTTYREVVVPQTAFQCMEYYSPKYLKMFDFMADNVRGGTNLLKKFTLPAAILPKKMDMNSVWIRWTTTLHGMVLPFWHRRSCPLGR